MSTAKRQASDDQTVRHWISETTTSAVNFERRWTWNALRRVDPVLARKLDEQRDLFGKACVTGTVDEVERQGAAMCRGWAVAIRAMEQAGEPDDAYMLGSDHRTGFRVAIGHQRAAAERVSEVHGASVVWITPDEVAAVLAGLEGFKALAAIKRMFPGAEVVDRHPREVREDV